MATSCTLRMRSNRWIDQAATLFTNRTAMLNAFISRLEAQTGITLPANMNPSVILDSNQGKVSNTIEADEAQYINPLAAAITERALATGENPKDFQMGVTNYVRMLGIIERVKRLMIDRETAKPLYTNEGKALWSMIRDQRAFWAKKVPTSTPQQIAQYKQQLLDWTNDLFDPDNAVRYFKDGANGAYKDKIEYEGLTWDDAEMDIASQDPKYAQFYAENYERFNAMRDEIIRRMAVSGQNGPVKDFVRDSYGWEHYMPFKTGRKENLEGFFDDFDVWESTGYLNDSDPELLKGRTQLAEDQIGQLQLDLLRAGKKMHDAEVARAIYETINTYGEAATNSEISEPYNTTPYDAAELGGPSKVGKISRSPNTIIVPLGDKSVTITIKDPDLFSGVKNYWAHTSDLANKIYSWTLRPFGNLKTKYNFPWQVYTNFIREFRNQFIYGALEHGYDKDGKMSLDISKRYMTNVLKFGGFKDAVNYHVKDYLGKQQLEAQGSEYAKWANKLVANGGESTFLQSMDIRSVQDKMDEIYARMIGGPNIKGRFAKANEFYEGIINGMEMSTRVALYKALVESKRMDELAAAIYVKNLMNFNHRGKWGDTLRALYLFYGPSAAGVFRMMDTLIRPKNPMQTYTIAAMYSAGVAFSYMLANMFMGEDDDGEDIMKKVSDDTLIRNTVVPTLGDDGTMPLIPRAIGLETMLAMPGVLAARLLLGHTNESKAIIAAVKTTLDNSSFVAPVDPGENVNAENLLTSLWMTLTPSQIRPLVEAKNNTTSQGIQIYNPYLDADTPKYMQGRDNTDELFKDWSKLSYDLFGEFGDFTPEALKHIFMQYGGVAATTVNRMATWNDKVLRGDPITMMDVPLMPTIQTKDVKYYPQRSFAEARRQWSLGKKEYKVYIDEGQVPSSNSVLAKSLDQEISSYDAKINKQIKAIRASDMDEREKADRIRVMLEIRTAIREQLVEQWKLEQQEE